MSIYILGMPEANPGRLGWDEETLNRRRAKMRDMEDQLYCFGYVPLNPARLPLDMLATAGLAARAAMIQASSACISIFPRAHEVPTIDLAIAEYLHKHIFHPEDIYTRDGVLRQNSPVEIIEGGSEGGRLGRAIPQDLPPVAATREGVAGPTNEEGVEP